jgi:hypothetical protein
MHVVITGLPEMQNIFADFFVPWVAQASQTCKYGGVASSTSCLSRNS